MWRTYPVVGDLTPNTIAAVDTATAREDVAAAARRLAGEGLVLGTAGNVSQRVGEELVAVTPTGAVLAELDAADVSVVSLDGAVVEGRLQPTSEVDLHLGAVRRHGSGAVVHTHAPKSTAAACVLTRELPCVHYGMLALGGDVPVAPYATFGTPELAESVVSALEGKAAVLMASHGAVTVGADAAAAVEASLLLEWAAEVYLSAAAVGTPHVMTEAERAAVIGAVVARGYGATREADS